MFGGGGVVGYVNGHFEFSGVGLFVRGVVVIDEELLLVDRDGQLGLHGQYRLLRVHVH